MDIVLRKPTRPLSLDNLSADYLIVIIQRDLSDVPLEPTIYEPDTTTFSQHLARIDDPVDDVAIQGFKGTSRQLAEILNQLEPKFCEKVCIDVRGFHVSAQFFRHLSVRFERMWFTDCHFSNGWWRPSPVAQCAELCFTACTFAPPPPGLLRGHASWPALETVSVRVNEVKQPQLVGGHMEAGARALAHAYWSQALKDLSLDWFSDISFVTEWPQLPKLKRLHMFSDVTPRVFGWIGQNSALSRLTLSWAEGTKLPWRESLRLKNLRSICVSDSPFDDDDFLAVAAHPNLAGIVAYYTKLTSASLPVMLAMPKIRQFWGSHHMIGPVSVPLPASTNLVEFVALNANAEWFRAFFRPYPGIKVVEM